MYKTQIVLGLLVLYMGISHSWEIAVAHGYGIGFYTNGVQTEVRTFSSYLRALAYDEVHDMLLFVDKQIDNDAICGISIPDHFYQCFLKRNGRNIHGLAFDPVTELLFFTDKNERSINKIPLVPGANNFGDLVIKLDEEIPTDIAVDSCRGYVYWISTNLPTPKIERVRFDGSEREVILNLTSAYIDPDYILKPHSLVIDQRKQRMYWIEPANSFTYHINYADLNGQIVTKTTIIDLPEVLFTNPASNRMTLSERDLFVSSWWPEFYTTISKMSKEAYVGSRFFRIVSGSVANQDFSIVARNQIRIQDIRHCEAVKCFDEKHSVDPYCVHGEKVFGRCLCKCAPGYIGKRCDVSVCDNYCLQGSCSLNDQGLPKCRCNAGYSGERCETDMCHGFCQNNGVCSLNEEDVPSCQCDEKYEGSRCEVLRAKK
ncbi:hypothetical protein PYW07_010937 [Mythimna separata]|uniref:Protein cueball n=1 Tax=Mythimna separata TaxID=271217 RepID=A0AAD7Y8J9_MYTSE|nr:hypothetical protein PYW07_010937 [Mythimna separata]